MHIFTNILITITLTIGVVGLSMVAGVILYKLIEYFGGADSV